MLAASFKQTAICITYHHPKHGYSCKPLTAPATVPGSRNRTNQGILAANCGLWRYGGEMPNVPNAILNLLGTCYLRMKVSAILEVQLFSTLY
jgi:hypothetical protein